MSLHFGSANSIPIYQPALSDFIGVTNNEKASLATILGIAGI
jgi:hypothetical protein